MYYDYKDADFSDLKGKTVLDIDKSSDEITFVTDSGKYKMYHSQDCCESVSIDEIHGDLDDLIGSPILLAEEVTSGENPPGVTKDYQDSFTWTFYKLSTINGSVTIRWYGSSNGYYSESVSFSKVIKVK